MFLSDYRHSVRTIRREAWIALAAYAAAGFTWFGLLDTIFNLFLVRMGFGLSFVGVSAAVATAGYALASIPSAALGRRLGERRTMIAGTVAWGTCIVALSLADLLPAAWQRPWVLVMRFLGTSGFTLYTVSNMPFLTGVTTPAERPLAFALSFSLNPLGAFLGASLGGLLPGVFAAAMGVSLDHPRPYGYALAVGMLVYVPVVWALRTLPEERGAASAGVVRATEHGRAPYALLGAMALVSLFRVGGEFVPRTFLNVYLDTVWLVPTATIGGVIAVASLLTIPAPLATPLLVKRWGRVATIVAGTLGVAVSIAAMAAGKGWAVAAAAYVAMNTLAAIARSVWMLLTQEIVTPEWRTMASAVTNLASGVSLAAMSSVGGILAERRGYATTFAIAAGLVVLGALVVWLSFRPNARHAEGTQAE
jgi:MFS family permease